MNIVVVLLKHKLFKVSGELWLVKLGIKKYNMPSEPRGVY